MAHVAVSKALSLPVSVRASLGGGELCILPPPKAQGGLVHGLAGVDKYPVLYRFAVDHLVWREEGGLTAAVPQPVSVRASLGGGELCILPPEKRTQGVQPLPFPPVFDRLSLNQAIQDCSPQRRRSEAGRGVRTEVP